MAYLLDSSCLIDCKNLYYAFDICPGFWDWLEQQNKSGVIYSIEMCKKELTDGDDELSQWAKSQGDGFFLPTDADVVMKMQEVSKWVTGNKRFPVHRVNEFLSKADPFLIAHSLAHAHKIITHETNDPNRLKIPVVCNHFDIECTSIFKLIKSTGAKFELS